MLFYPPIACRSDARILRANFNAVILLNICAFDLLNTPTPRGSVIVQLSLALYLPSRAAVRYGKSATAA